MKNDNVLTENYPNFLQIVGRLFFSQSLTPKLVIEVDVNVEAREKNTSLFEEFLLRKVRKLHAFGTEKIIWIFTTSKTVIIARPNNIWEVLEWDTEVELLDNITFNIAEYLKDEGIIL